MEFASDNVVGASGPVMEALLEAGRAGSEGTYGTDRWTRRAEALVAEVFGQPAQVLLVPTGTAANALCLAAVTPPGGGVLCHQAAHVNEDECGAPEFFTGGAKLVGIPGAAGKVTPDALAETLTRFPPGGLRQVEAAALSLSQATECGTAYTPAEVGALAGIAHAAGLRVHMDGARLANALVDLGCTPAALTWEAGVDVLSLGATKNGALACEAVVAFDAEAGRRLSFLRKRSGHTLSKGRVLGAQMAAYLADGHWLALARHANARAARLAAGLEARGFRLPWPRQANEVFVVLPGAVDAALRASGAHYYPWDAAVLSPAERPVEGEVLVRLVCSFATTEAEVDALLAATGRAGRAGAVPGVPPLPH